jgi:hypothetical protein
MANRDDKEQEKPPKGSVAETFKQFGEERRFIGREEILKHTPSVDGARRKGAPGPKDVLGYVGVVRMHESGDPASPTGFGALLAFNGRGDQQFIMLGPFDTADEAAAAYDAHVDRFHPPPAAGKRPKPKNVDAHGRPAAHGVLRRRVHLQRARPGPAVERGAGEGEGQAWLCVF